MAEFTAGDRVVKMSGIAAGKYGTVNSVREDGTLNVTFDGERMARFCDPERCGKVAANAKFKVGDIVVDKGFPSVKLRIVQDDSRYNPNEHTYAVKPLRGRAVTTSREEDLKLANSRAANAKFKVGDEVVYKANGHRGQVKEIDGDRIGVRWILSSSIEWHSEDEIKKATNARACNRASVFEYGVGDTVKLRSGRTGEVLSKYVDKDGNLSIEINLNGTRYAVSADMVDSVVKNARACNAEIAPELRKAYDEWQKAKAKFDKWWNPNRRLSENPPKGADATRKQLDFAAVFKKVTGKLTPNGYGSMTLEQMVDAVS